LRPPALFAALALGAAPSAEYQRAAQKIELIRADKAAKRSTVSFTPAEINAYAAYELLAAVPAGARNPRVQLRAGGATGTAMLDFVALRTAQGEPPGRLMAWLLGGERPVAVTVRLRSSGGWCTVFVDSVEISGIPVRGAMLDWLIENYLLPRYPEAKIGKPFQLEHNVDRIEVSAGGVRVVMGG
jgi:hypothetical protein